MLPYQTMPQKEDGIAIVGIGGAGANILQCFAGSSANNVRLYTLSLDERLGRSCGSNIRFVQLGGGLIHGLGSGGDPTVGAQAAAESREAIESMLADTRLLVLVAGLGGGTGSGATPVLAQMAREAGLFLVSVLIMPFSFEGKRRREQAELALEEVARQSDIVFCFENDYMEELFRHRPGARAVFEEVDRILARATAAVPMLASSPGFINLGLDELVTALENNDSRCIFGTGSGYGSDRARVAARAALESPLVAHHEALSYARTVIVHIAGGDSMSITELRVVMETVRAALADEEVNVFFGTTVKPHLGDEIRVTLIASINAEEFKIAAALREEQVRSSAEEIEGQEPTIAGLPQDSAADQPLAGEQDMVDESSVFDEHFAVEAPVADEPTVVVQAAAAPSEEEVADVPDGDSADEPAAEKVASSTPDEEEGPLSFTMQPSMHQPELMPVHVAEADDEEEAPMFNLTGGAMFGHEASATGNSRMLTRRRPVVSDEDDLDSPPNISFNDLRGIFNRN